MIVFFFLFFSRQIDTTTLSISTWTQWIFLTKSIIRISITKKTKRSQLKGTLVKEKLKMAEQPNFRLHSGIILRKKGIAGFTFEYRFCLYCDAPVNWCPELGTVIANEEVDWQEEKGFCRPTPICGNGCCAYCLCWTFAWWYEFARLDQFNFWKQQRNLDRQRHRRWKLILGCKIAMKKITRFQPVLIRFSARHIWYSLPEPSLVEQISTGPKKRTCKTTRSR